jgi:hypothetical protein
MFYQNTGVKKPTIVQISQNSRHNQRNTFAVCASSGLKVDSKSLSYCTVSFDLHFFSWSSHTIDIVVVILVRHHFGHKWTSAIILEKISEVS